MTSSARAKDPADGMLSPVLARVTTSLVFFAILLFGLFTPLAWGAHVIFAIVVTATVVGTHEYYNMARRLKVRPSPWPGHVIALAFLVDAYWFEFAHFVHLFIACFWMLLITQVSFKRYDLAIVNIACSLFGSIYVGLPLAILLFLFKYPDKLGYSPLAAPAWAGGNLLMFLIATSWMTDIGGYSFGHSFGRHKMTPVLSPNKTWEGLAGGIGLAMVSGVALKALWPGMGQMISWPEAFGLPILFSVVGTVGDLAESAFKRDAAVKDSGKTFTGHGGMLDIIDSILLCAPVFYLYLALTKS